METTNTNPPQEFEDYESRRIGSDSPHNRSTEKPRQRFHADLKNPDEKLLLDTDENGSFETQKTLNTKGRPEEPIKKYADSERGYGSGLGGSYPPESYDSDQEETAFFGRPQE